jgi:hypothetical protein
VASSFRAARSVSATNSSRLSTRMAARTCVESVRGCPRALRDPKARHRSRSLSNKRTSVLPASRRSRNSLSTEKSQPGSLNSRPRRYFQSIRARTASAAWRSDNCSRNCRMVIRARRHGGRLGWPPMGNRAVKSSSWKITPS